MVAILLRILLLTLAIAAAGALLRAFRRQVPGAAGGPRPGPRSPRGGPSEGPDPERDPHGVLGVSPGADADQIRTAYKRKLAEYHPDKVADLGEELREVAHRRTKDIIRAYEILSGER